MFHNIFNRTSKKQNITKPRIIVDIKEKNSLVPACLIGLDCDIEFKDLKVGDYILGNLIIERKTSSDFISSMINKRLVQQINNMNQYKEKLLIIEGDFKINKESKLNPNSVRGFISSLTLRNNFPIIFTRDEEDTASYLRIISRQQLTKPAEISLHSRIPKTRIEQQRYILESFPNIGPKTSMKLLKKFKTLKTLFNSQEEDLKEILKSRTGEFKDLLE